MRSGKDFNPVMAFNGVRISDNRAIKTYERNMVPRNAPQKNNFTSNGKGRENVIKGQEKDLENDSQHNWILNELDFDKVVAQNNVAQAHLTDPPT